MMEDEDLLLAVLNTAPRHEGTASEHLDAARGATLARRHGGTGSDEELLQLRRVRDALQELIRGHEDAIGSLQSVMDEVGMRPRVTPRGIRWDLVAPEDLMLAARVVRAWAEVNERMPGRLKACANEECNLYLIDRTRPGTAKWCSMATCGNRMKARAHAARARASTRP
jgi:predicted RNA-binding Zn ribbon-like protein